MLKHLWLMMRRRFKKDKSSFFINLIGLSTGLTCVLLVYLWVNNELSSDNFHKKGSRLYHIMNNLAFSQDIQTVDITPVPLAPTLAKEMPEVEYAVAVNDSWANEGVISAGDTHIQAKAQYAGKDFFNVFSYGLVQGEKSRVLADKNNVVISEALARKLFNTTDNVTGKTLHWKHPYVEGVFRVAGVFKSPPPNSTAQFDLLLSTGVLLDNNRDAKNWTGNNAKTYVVLREGADVKQFDRKIAGFLKAQSPLTDKSTLFAQLYSARYLHGHYENGKPAGGRIEYIRLFSIVAIFILLIACVNFMNLSTAKASLKMKEIGVKKAVGASRKALIIQFVGESLVTAFLSLLVAILLVVLVLPQFNEIAGKQLRLTFRPVDMLAFAGIVLVTGLLAGSYPAFYLSGFKPVTVLKGKLSASTGELWMRKGLVIFQFALSVIFIAGVLIVNEQIKFTQSRNLGYNRDNIVCFKWKGELYDQWNGLAEGKSNEKFEAFMLGLKNVPGVVNVTNMSGNILDNIFKQSGISWSGRTEERNYHFQSPVVGYDFIEMLGMQLKKGRTFSRDYHDDYSKVIINEAAAKLMGFKEPVGKTIQMNGNSQIIGVIQNFHYGSLHNAIEPLILRFDPNGKNVMVRIKAGAEKNTIERLRKYYSSFLPSYTFDFTFMDDDYRALYDLENRVAALSNYLAAIAIIISCLGLLGLAEVTLQKRFKEISIRKIHGSTVSNIVLLLSRDFMKPVFISILIAVPLSYLLAVNWLRSFSYSIGLHWWFFLIAVVMTLFIAWMPVLIQTVRVARLNPVKGLKDD